MNHSDKMKSKLPNVGTTIFTIMSQMALDHNAINLGQGFPDFNPDSRLIELVHQAMLEGHNQYPAMPGIPSLRQEISRKMKDLHDCTYDPETEVTITSGASEALMCSILALVGAGDEVIVVEPFYDLYIPAIQLAGATPVIVPMLAPDDDHAHYRMDWQRLRDAITPKSRIIVLNFPHNPTGIILEEHDLDILAKLVEETGIIILSDEVYEHIVFDSQPHRGMATRKILADNSVIVSSFGKTFHATGWKIGYCLARHHLMHEIRKVHQFIVFTVSSPMQYALAEFLKDKTAYTSLSSFYEAKRDYLSQGLAKAGFKPLRSQGTFFLLADYGNLSQEMEMQFAKRLTTKHGVTVIPMSAFYRDPEAVQSNHNLVRFCFAKQDATLDLALARLSKMSAV